MKQQSKGQLVMKRHVIAVLAATIVISTNGSLWAADESEFRQRIEQLEQMLKQQQQRIVQLESSESQAQDAQLGVDEQEEIRQLIRESLDDVELRSQLMGDVLSAGYDEGFFVRSADNAYLFKINTLLQFRYYGINRGENLDSFGVGTPQGNSSPERTDRSDFELERARIRFSGHIPSGLNDNPIEYYIQLALGTDHRPAGSDGADIVNTLVAGPGGIGPILQRARHAQLQDDQSGGVHLKDWYVKWKYAEWMAVKAGQYTMPFGRQETTAPEQLMLIDRSLANETFNLDRSIGVGLLGDFLLLNQNMSYEVMLANGFRQANRTEAAQEIDSLMAFAGRLVWHQDGSSADDFADESALGFETGRYDDLKLSTGLSFAFMDDNNRSSAHPPSTHYFVSSDSVEGPANDVGNIPLTQDLFTEPIYTEVTQFGADIAMKWTRLSASAEWFMRMIDFDKDVTFGAPPDLALSTIHQQGGHVQAGWFFTPKIEAVVRLGGVWDNADDNVWEYASGVNYYIRGHDVKLSLDYTGTHEATTISNDAGFGLNEEAGMWRGQLQVLF